MVFDAVIVDILYTSGHFIQESIITWNWKVVPMKGLPKSMYSHCWSFTGQDQGCMGAGDEECLFCIEEAQLFAMLSMSFSMPGHHM